jgi:hypothetical protein
MSARSGYHADAEDLERAGRLFQRGRHAEGWELLRAVLKRHPWRPRRVRKHLRRRVERPAREQGFVERARTRRRAARARARD